MGGLRRESPDKPAELWAGDEARLGLKPIARRAWAVRGRRPTASVRTRCRWLYAYGLVHPAGGRNLEPIPPAAGADRMGLAPEEFARWADPAGEKLLAAPVGNAGWHVAKRRARPPNGVLHPPPPCTPELQPAEPLWPLVREVVANEGYDDLEEMQPAPVGRCRWRVDHPEVVRGAVGFHWAVALNG